MIEMRNLRGSIREIVSSLHQIDDRLAELAESLPLSPDATEMWEARIPTSATTNLYAALDAVRSDCIQDAIETLLHAARQSDLSLRREFLRGRAGRLASPRFADRIGSGISGEGGVSFRKPQQHPGERAGGKEPPPC